MEEPSPMRSARQWLPFTEYEILRALRQLYRSGEARRAARRLARQLPRLAGFLATDTDRLPFDDLLALLAVRSPDAARRADEVVARGLEERRQFEYIGAYREHGVRDWRALPAGVLDGIEAARARRWVAWEARKQAAAHAVAVRRAGGTPDWPEAPGGQDGRPPQPQAAT